MPVTGLPGTAHEPEQDVLSAEHGPSSAIVIRAVKDVDGTQVAMSLRVSTKSVYQWRRAWRVGGGAALASKGLVGSPCNLDEAQVAQLRTALEAGPAAYGWEQNQRWTLARVTARSYGP